MGCKEHVRRIYNEHEMIKEITSCINTLLYFAWVHQRHRQCCICHTAPEGGSFVPCDTFYAPTHRA